MYKATIHKERGLIVKTAKNGLGIFTTKKFKKEEIIFEVKGKLFHFETVYKIGDTFQDNTFRYSLNKYLSPAGYIGDYLNHSCQPNASVLKKDKKLFIVALEPLRPGTEVVIDYSTILARDDIWTMKCACDAKGCRKLIRKFSTLPKSLLLEYKSRGVIPSYILNI